MRSLLSLLLAFVVAASALFLSGGGVANAAFHCMRIHAVMGGFNGDNNIQYVELRMDMAGQTFLAGHTIQFFNTSGALRATFTFPLGTFAFGASVANGAVGDSVLIATSEFYANVGVTPGPSDFTFTGANTTGPDALHPVQLLDGVPGGKVVFAGPSAACLTVVAPVDSVAYGGASATPYGPAAAALPNPGTTQALRLSNLNIVPSDNFGSYALQNVSPTTFTVGNPPGCAPGNCPHDNFTTPRNNSRTVLKLIAATSVGGIAEVPALPDAATASVSASGGSDSSVYAIAGGVAAAAIACGAGWYVYRRRTS